VVQILVVVATTQARTLRAEAEKGFSRTALARELVDPKSPPAGAKRSIGRKPGFPDRVAKGNRGPPSRTWDRTVGGDAADPRDGGCGPGKSSLFSATRRRTPESRRAGRGSESGKSTPVSRGVRRAAAVPGKSGGAPCGTGPGRTHDRIGSPRLKASGHRDNVGKPRRERKSNQLGPWQRGSLRATEAGQPDSGDRRQAVATEALATGENRKTRKAAGLLAASWRLRNSTVVIRDRNRVFANSAPNPEQPPQGGGEGSRRGGRKAEPKVAERMPQGRIEGRL